jgi:hypothetical protein
MDRQYRQFAAAHIAASLAAVRHPHGPHPLYAPEVVVKTSIEIATLLEKSLAALDATENAAREAEREAAAEERRRPKDAPKDAPKDVPDKNEPAAGGDASESKGDGADEKVKPDAPKSDETTTSPQSPHGKRSTR